MWRHPGRDLIQEDEVRLRHQAAREFQELLLAAGEDTCRLVLVHGERDESQYLAGPHGEPVLVCSRRAWSEQCTEQHRSPTW